MTGEPDVTDVVLRCRECGRDAPSTGPQYCGWCFAAVEVILAPPPFSAAELRTVIGSGPASVGRYEPLLPSGLALAGAVAGWTPLRRAPTLGAAIGIDDLWVKDETANPTGSFKDRVVEVAVARGLTLGMRVLACSSTGNLARAVAGAAARRGLPSVVLVPEGLPADEIEDLANRGSTVVAVRGGYDAASRLAADAAADLDRWAWVNVGLRPWYELGARTTGWEIAEQLRWRLPDRTAVPMASGALARAIHESTDRLVECGLVAPGASRLTVLQPAGCAPVAAAFDAGASDVKPMRVTETVAPSLAMGDPPDGRAVLAAARASGGVVHAVAEDEVLAAATLVHSTEGIAVEPAGGVVVAGLARLAASGVVGGDETVVAVLPGRPPRVSPAPRDGGLVSGGGLAGTIDPSVSALTELLPSELFR